jgi:methenyltetrahydromethanopterin cyclohydrolase
MPLDLNLRAQRLVDDMCKAAGDLRVHVHDLPCGTRMLDCGIETAGGLNAGLHLARVCLSDLGSVTLIPGELGTRGCPYVQVYTDHPTAACMASQYAGWQIAVGKFFAMGSGPMRAVAGREELFEKIGHREQSPVAVGVLETRKLPGDDVVAYLTERLGLPPRALALLVVPTASIAGTLQVVARSVETCLHKMFELSYDLSRVVSGYGVAPLPPPARNDLDAIGWTNDAILYGARVVLWVRDEDRAIEALGPRVPSCASRDFGAPFREIFERAGRDFYKVDRHLFSPAQVTIHSLGSGRSFTYGAPRLDICERSFHDG